MKTIADRALSVSASLTLELTAKGKKMEDEGIDVVSFGAGEPDFNTPEYINTKGKEAIDKGITKYTAAQGMAELRKTICEKLKKDNDLIYDPSQIIVSNGAKHSLYNAFLAIVNPGDEVILPAPYWLTYPELIKLCGGVVKILETDPENNFKITPESLKKAITPKTKVLVLNSPSNPTGAVYSEKELRALAEVIEEADIYVISDEIYEKLVYSAEFFSIAACGKKLLENTIIVNGMSKSHSMTGWRIGYTASNHALAKVMANIQSHTTSNPNSIAQYATITALSCNEGEAFLKRMLAIFKRRRELALTKLKNMKPLTYIEPEGAFYIMVGIHSLIGKNVGGLIIKSAADVAAVLLEKGKVLTIPCESFGAPEYLRLSYAMSDEKLTKGLDRIKEVIEQVN